MRSEDEASSHQTPVQREPEEVELPQIGSLVYMYVTHVQSPKNICMRNIDGDNEDVLIKLEDELTDFVFDNGRKLDNVQVIIQSSEY